MTWAPKNIKDADKHFLGWGATADRCTAEGQMVKAAYVGADQVMLISRRAVADNNMPPGFTRFLTQAERAAKGCADLLSS